MDRVFLRPEHSLEDVGFVAISVFLNDANQPDEQHIGIIYKEADSERRRFLHLAWHHKLRNEDAEKAIPRMHSVWVDIDIPERRARQVAGQCRKVWKSNGRFVPYAFSPPNHCFDAETGEFLMGPTRLGLTCATFVLAVFAAQGIRFVNFESWPPRDDDIRWQRTMISLLEDTDAPALHIEAVQQREVGAIRIRPAEVAGAAALFPPSVHFSEAEEIGKEITGQLLRT